MTGDAGPIPRRARWVEGAVYAVALLAAGVALYRARRFHEDDAFITMRYAARWLSGQGLTWTDGERVEGYSNPLWLVQIALLGRLGVALPVAARWLGVAYLGGLLVVYRRAGASAWSALALATAPGVAVWAMGGLETVGFSFWVVLGAWATWRVVRGGEGGEGGLGAGACLAAAALTRPEGLGVGLLALVWIASARRWRAVASAAASFAAPVLAWEVLRLAYYGDLVSNSVRAKTGDYPLARSIALGLEYLGASSVTWAPLFAAALVALALAQRREGAWMLSLGLPIVGAVLLGGGDHMIATRLLVPVEALAIFAAGLHGARAAGRATRAWIAPAALAAAALSSAPLALARDRAPDRAEVIGSMVGRYLEENLAPGSLVAISVAGSTAFVAPSLRFIDTLGLSDAHVARHPVAIDVTRWQVMAAHRRGDGAYVLSRAPDVIILGGAAGYLGFDDRQWFLTDYELLQLPGFRVAYRPYRFPLAEADGTDLAGLALFAYLRRESPAARALAGQGTRARAPWDSPRARWTSPAASTGVSFEER